ncbi:MAG: adenylate/guanylate cyclase domain-containing protein [Cyclobacteriaceae bacterium]|nr:adenylate/guanylate cyclase domain-containing protein [Cyclobacteriaceae bacterium]
MFYIVVTVLSFGLFAALLYGFEHPVLLSSIIYSLPTGVLFAIVDIHMSETRSIYRNPSYLSFIGTLGLKIALVLITYYTFIFFITYWLGLGDEKGMFYSNTKIFLFSALPKIASLALILLLLLSVYSAISRKFGSNVLWQLLTGYYHKPRSEKRVFMFVDVKNSTGMGETLPLLKYSELLQEFFFDVGIIIHLYKGMIYQHVGDEVVITWKIEQNMTTANFIRCYFAMKLRIKRKERFYMERFGIVPDFRAAFHCGEVVTSEVGKYKVEIAYHGDVVNTTARIVDKCKTLECDVLISEDVYELIKSNANYVIESLGIRKLKGKSQKKELFTIRQRSKKEFSNPLEMV